MEKDDDNDDDDATRYELRSKKRGDWNTPKEPRSPRDQKIDVTHPGPNAAVNLASKNATNTDESGVPQEIT